MRALVVALLALLAGCGISQAPNEIRVQRFFGTCPAQYARNTDLARAEGECGIITTLLNEFAAENQDIRVTVSPVPWPGYNQLSAQLAADDAPDIVTMHESAISDFQSRHLLEPVGPGLRSVGIDPATFTDASVKGVTKDGEIWGLPFDTWTMLWHINLNYFRQAGLVKDGEPILPHSPEELLQQARQFKQATGKPYLVQALANQNPVYARNLYNYLLQQYSKFFGDPKLIILQTA
jgi:multiple sugar transport system substrate-binding protein